MIAIGHSPDLSFEVEYAEEGLKKSAKFECLVDEPTIVSVYMRNNTGSCDKQILSLVKAFSELESLGYHVIGLSKDSVGAHLKYASTHGVPFPLVSDPHHLFASATDSLIEKKMYGRTFWGPKRVAYVFGAGKKVIGVCDPVDVARHGDQLLDFVTRLV